MATPAASLLTSSATAPGQTTAAPKWSSDRLSSTDLASIASFTNAGIGQFASATQSFGAYFGSKSQIGALQLQELQTTGMVQPGIADAAEFQKEQINQQARLNIGNIRVQAARSGMVVGQGSYAQAEQRTREVAAQSAAQIDRNARTELAATELQLGNIRAQKAALERMQMANFISGIAGIASGVLNIGGAGALAYQGGTGAGLTGEINQNTRLVNALRK